MRRFNRYLGLLLLGATFLLPSGLQARNSSRQGEPHQNDQKDKQYYDKNHKDYHMWDKSEDGTYRHWLDGRHEKYRDFSKLNSKEQSQYWTFRHSH
jgi:hypothetical protein